MITVKNFKMQVSNCSLAWRKVTVFFVK